MADNIDFYNTKRQFNDDQYIDHRVHCGFRYVQKHQLPQSLEGEIKYKWMCDKEGCNAYIIERIKPNGDYNISLQGPDHTHPPYPMLYDYPYPHIPGAKYPYIFMRDCLCSNTRKTSDALPQHCYPSKKKTATIGVRKPIPTTSTNNNNKGKTTKNNEELSSSSSSSCKKAIVLPSLHH